ncbi:MAG: GGDEF domain-containing protein [Oceanospirillaceae bacterium]|nr:GGDEF domain-containing protein [Oceanospirillaceae bacterium]MAX98988.1 GGDEF domain-containing protein [Oceanospirillaceae bacterium]MBS54840.1 GGDEF domain-containing protein [Oceanospirillaceae bacterium]
MGAVLPAIALIRPALFPLLSLLLCWLALPHLNTWADDYGILILAAPFILAALCLLLAQVFSQGRIGQMAVLTIASYSLIQWQMQSTLDDPETWWLYFWLTLLFPLNTLFVRFLPDRRPLSPEGMLFPALLLLQAGLLLWLPQHMPAQIPTQRISEWVLTFLRQGDDPLLPLPAMFSFAIAAILLCVRLPRERDIPLAFVGLLILHGLMFWQFDQSYMSALTATLSLLLLLATLLITNHQLAFIDELTSLPGRRALMNDLKHRHGHYLLVMADIDHFKQFNDTHGHDTGDHVLRLVASQLAKTRGGCRAYRYGGEEFTLVFPSMDAIDCRPFIEATRERIAAYPLVIRDKQQRPANNRNGKKQRGRNSGQKALRVTMSFGVARRQKGETIEAVMKRADKALYKAKQNGRNRTEDAV